MLNQNVMTYSRERRRFGRQCNFTDRTQFMCSVQSSQRLRSNYILRNPVNNSIQLSEQMALSIMETENVTLDDHGVVHYEGGWPKDVNLNDEEATLRHRKKIERDDNWGIEVKDLIQFSMDKGLQNSAIDIYLEFFEDLPLDLAKDIRMPYEARQKNLFHDQVMPARRIVRLDWQPQDNNKFLALHVFHEEEQEDSSSEEEDVDDGDNDYMNYTIDEGEEEDAEPGYSEMTPERWLTEREKYIDFNEDDIEDLNPPAKEEVDGVNNSFFTWDLENPLKPLITYENNDPVRRARYCPRDENFVAGGTIRGQVAAWDAKVGEQPFGQCPIQSGHREAVTAICWVHSKSNTEFYTSSTDGSILFWDTRDLQQSTGGVLLDPVPTDDQSRARAHGACALEFEYTIPVRFMVGSIFGTIFVGNRKASSPAEMFVNNFKLFVGPIRSIQRNPFFVKNFVITGDYCAKIWSEECKNAPTTLLFRFKTQVLVASWSTTRCSLFVTGTCGGNLDFWDLLLDQRKPIFSMQYSHPVMCIRFRPDGAFIAVGLKDGDVHILEMDHALRFSGHKDRALIAALFEREVQRSKLLEGRVEELKLRRKTALANQLELELAEPQAPPPNPEDPDEFLQIVEADLEFKEALRVFNDTTYKIAKKRQDRKMVFERTPFERRYFEAQARIAEEEAAAAAAAALAADVAKQANDKKKQEKGKKKK